MICGYRELSYVPFVKLDAAGTVSNFTAVPLT